jgi:hypothetical protein
MHVDVHRSGLKHTGGNLRVGEAWHHRAHILAPEPAEIADQRRAFVGELPQRGQLRLRRDQQGAARRQQRCRRESAGRLLQKRLAGTRQRAHRRVAIGLGEQRR